MTRVLVVWPYAPWPAVTGTSRRLARLTEELARRATVGVVIADETVAPAHPAGIDVVATPVRRASRARSALGLVGAARRRDPYFTAFYRRASTRAEVRRVLDAWQPDVVWTHGLAGDALVRGLIADDRLILDLSDAEHLRFEQLAGTVAGWRGWLWQADVPRVRRWVAERLPRLRAVTVVSETDRDAYAELAPGAAYLLVPNGVDPSPSPRPDPGGSTVVFLGDLGYPPNADALDWFVSHVLPRAESVGELLVVGRGRVPSGAKIVPAGFVPDLADVWVRSAVMVVPVRSGGGTRLKVLDAFGAGVPVVSTRFGVSGLGAVAGRHFAAAETAPEFVEALAGLLGDAGLRRRMSDAAHLLVRERFTWPTCIAPLVELVATDSEHGG